MLFLRLYHLLKQTHINPGVLASLLTNKSVTTILDKIKWNSKPPSPQIKPQIKDEAVRRVKTRHFPILDLGERGGGLGFPFILSKIVGFFTRPRGQFGSRVSRLNVERSGRRETLCMCLFP